MIVIQNNNLINDVANYHFRSSAGWIIAIVLGGGYAVARVSIMVSRRRAGIPLGAWWWQLGKVLAVVAIVFVVVAITNHDQGVPSRGCLWLFLFIAASYLAGKDDFRPPCVRRGGQL